MKSKCSLFNIRYIHKYKVTKLWSRKWHICPKVTKIGSIIGHRIDYNGVGALRGQWHIPSKNWPKYPPPPHPPVVNLGSHLPSSLCSNPGRKKEAQLQVARWVLKIIGDSGKLYKPSFEMSVYCLAKTEERAREVEGRGARGTFF